VGFRAPSAADLTLGLGEWLADQPGDGGRYRDPPLSAEHATGEIEAASLDAFRQVLARSLEDESDLATFIGQFMSRFRQAHEPLPTPSAAAASTLERALDSTRNTTTHWVTHPWARFAWVRIDEQSARLFASGRKHRCTPAFAEWVCRGAGSLPVPGPIDLSCLEQLARSGHLIPEHA
jgi:ribosomal protein L16 Arg81 hydroxylase